MREVLLQQGVEHEVVLIGSVAIDVSTLGSDGAKLDHEGILVPRLVEVPQSRACSDHSFLSFTVARGKRDHVLNHAGNVTALLIFKDLEKSLNSLFKNVGLRAIDQVGTTL
jgi:hypothetical protein